VARPSNATRSCVLLCSRWHASPPHPSLLSQAGSTAPGPSSLPADRRGRIFSGRPSVGAAVCSVMDIVCIQTQRTTCDRLEHVSCPSRQAWDWTLTTRVCHCCRYSYCLRNLRWTFSMMPGGGLEFNCEKPKEQLEDLGISASQSLGLLPSSIEAVLCGAQNVFCMLFFEHIWLTEWDTAYDRPSSLNEMRTIEIDDPGCL